MRESVTPNLFAFYQEDGHIADKLIPAVRNLLRRVDIKPSQLGSLGKLLYALERLPRATLGLEVELNLSYAKPHKGGSFQTIKMYADLFSLERTVCYYEPDVGDDHHTTQYLSVMTSGERYSDVSDWYDVFLWLDRFADAVADPECEVLVYDSSGEINWQEENDTTDYWAMLLPNPEPLT